MQTQKSVTEFLPMALEKNQDAPIVEATTRFTNMNDPIHARMKDNKYYGKRIMLRSVFGKHSQATPIEPSHLRGDDDYWLGVPGMGDTPELSEEDKRNTRFQIAKPGTTRVKIEDGMIIDLGTEKALYFWEWAQHAPQIVDTREDTDLDPEKPHEGADSEYYVMVPDEEEANIAKTFSDRLKAQNYIQGMAPTGWYQLAYLLGSNMSNAKPVTVYNYLFGISQTKPSRILEKKNDKFSHLKLLFMQLKDQGVIKVEAGVYSYNNQSLGTSDEQVLHYMKQAENQVLVSYMEKDLKVNIGNFSGTVSQSYANYAVPGQKLAEELAARPSSTASLGDLPDLPTHKSTGNLPDSVEEEELGEEEYDSDTDSDTDSDKSEEADSADAATGAVDVTNTGAPAIPAALLPVPPTVGPARPGPKPGPRQASGRNGKGRTQ